MMKATFVAIIVLSLTAHSLAYGQDPGSGGAQCVYDCMWPEKPETTGARSAFEKVVQRRAASKGDTCTHFEEKMACVEICQVEKYTTLAREFSRIWEKYCGDSANEATRKKFVAENDQFLTVWSAAVEVCNENTTTPEEDCKDASNCVFGSALASAKYGFSEDVVTVKVILNKINYAATFETSYAEKLPGSCDFLFEPNVPEPPYPHKPYQRNPYQRNPYQRNPYKRRD